MGKTRAAYLRHETNTRAHDTDTLEKAKKENQTILLSFYSKPTKQNSKINQRNIDSLMRRKHVALKATVHRWN